MPDRAVTALWDRRTGQDVPDLSFVVPCKNEERYLVACLESLRRFAPTGLRYEIIFVDNGSIDGSVEIAERAGVDVGLTHSGRIGFGRNEGAGVARADLLVFVDADVCLTAKWQARAENQWDIWNEATVDAVWGSWYSVREEGTWIEKAWFDPYRLGPKTHMNGGHMIVRRKTFWDLGGFSPLLETGEDYEFSRRAQLRGLVISNDEELEVIHLGYPQTLRGFFSRELWHGRGDVSSLSHLVSSKTAMASLAAVHAIPVGAVAAISGLPLPLAASLFAVMPLMSVALVVRTFGQRSQDRFGQKVVLGVVYIAARGLTLYSSVSRFFLHKGISPER